MLLNKTDLFQNQDWLKNRNPNAHSNGEVVDDIILNDQSFAGVLQEGSSYLKTLDIMNKDRAVGVRVAGAIARAHGDNGLAEKGGAIEITYRGAAG